MASPRNGHFVAPTIARAELVKPRQQPGPDRAVTGPAPAYRPKIVKFRSNSPKAKIKRAIKAQNYQVRARAIRQQQRDS